MTALSVNLNKVALLRNAREHGVPNVVDAARTVIDAGAHGITVHPRPDMRHIRPDDVERLAELLEDFDAIEFNIEGNPAAEEGDNGYPGYLKIVEAARPDQATLVPDSPGQLTSDHGFDGSDETVEWLRPIVADLHRWGCRVSLFSNADPRTVRALAETGADRIEIYTGPFAEAAWSGDAGEEVSKIAQTEVVARELGLGVNAGHDLDLSNLPILMAAVPGIDEVSIGHALTADALWMGLEATVKRYLEALGR